MALFGAQRPGGLGQGRRQILAAGFRKFRLLDGLVLLAVLFLLALFPAELLLGIPGR
jgi:hypothetical protein